MKDRDHRFRLLVWIIVAAIVLIVTLLILMLTGVFSRRADVREDSRSVKLPRAVSVPARMVSENTKKAVRYNYDLENGTLTIGTSGTAEAAYGYPYFNTADPVIQSICQAAFNVFDFSPAILFSCQPIVKTGAVDQVIYQENGTETDYLFTTDTTGKITKCQIDQNGSTYSLLYDYDADGRLLKAADSDGQYEFDICYQGDRIQKFTILNRSHAIPASCRFDGRGRLIQMNYTGLRTGKPISVHYTYNNNGLLSKKVLKGQETVFHYNRRNEITSFSIGKSKFTVSYQTLR